MKHWNRFNHLGRRLGYGACALAIGVTSAVAQDDVDDSLDRDYSAELPRFEHLAPADALGSFEIHPDFELDQVAAEPLVADPIALSFDEQGRMFVVEMRGYSEQYDDTAGLISRLVDTDGDGHFDKRSVYVENLAWPTAVTCYDGGVYVGVPPDILYCKDTTGDGVADVREVVYTGFSLKNVQGLMNTLKWGMDNQIYGATSTSGADVKPGNDPSALSLTLRGRDFKIDPKTRKLTPVTGGGQHGMSFDAWGRKFVSSNSNHIQQVMYDDDYLARNPYLTPLATRSQIASDGASATVYRLSPDEPWRVVRTRLRAKGIVPGIVEGGGTPSGYFTGATGVTIYRGNAWADKYYGNAFIGDAGSQLVHRKTINEDNVLLVADRARENTEFLRSSDTWFRPVQYANGPDGTLYVIDMYREVIEHPLSLPPLIKKHLDLTSGGNMGRIYRVIPKGFKQPALPQLHKASTAELVATLDHDNGWHRETAARLLYEQQDENAVTALQTLVAKGSRPEGRIRALYALDSMGALAAADVKLALKDDSVKVREHALRKSESFLAADEALLDAVLALQSDETAQVQYQLAFSLGAATGSKRNAALAQSLIKNLNDPWITMAAKSSLYIGADETLQNVLADAGFRSDGKAAGLVQELAKFAGTSGTKDSLGALVASLNTLTGADAKLAQAAVRGVIQGMQLGGQGSLAPEVLAESALAQKLLSDMIASARTTAVNNGAKAELRIAAIKNLSFAPAEESLPLLGAVLADQSSSAVQIAAIKTLGGYISDDAPEALLANFDTFSPTVRAQAVETLFSRKAWVGLALGAIEADRFSAKALDSNRIHFLLNNPDAAIKAQATKLLGTHTPTPRDTVVEEYRPALTMAGDIEKGRAIFMEQCSKCHQLEGKGFAVGPDLGSIGARGAEAILLNVLDPNREINPAYVNFTVETTDWETFSGIIASETATSITVQRANGEADTILRVNIESTESAELSLMPEGLEAAIDQQSMANLIAYLLSLNS